MRARSPTAACSPCWPSSGSDARGPPAAGDEVGVAAITIAEPTWVIARWSPTGRDGPDRRVGLPTTRMVGRGACSREAVDRDSAPRFGHGGGVRPWSDAQASTSTRPPSGTARKAVTPSPSGIIGASDHASTPADAATHACGRQAAG